VYGVHVVCREQSSLGTMFKNLVSAGERSMWDDVREFTQKAGACDSVADLNHAFGSMAESWGFEHFVAIQVSARQQDLRAPLARSFGSPPEQWLHRYQEAGHVHRDAGIKRIMSSVDPYWWRDLENSRLESDERLVMEEAREFGLGHGLVVPVRQPDGSVWSCLMAAEHVEESDDLKLAAVVAANYYVGRGMLLQAGETRKIDLAYRLTRRQREVILWMARGLTTDEIGEVIGISGRTVAHHVEDAKLRLNARTQASLLAEALLHGEIALSQLSLRTN
jgi:LuxR family transcriptional regulator, quorum-sensing system regulator CciR